MTLVNTDDKKAVNQVKLLGKVWWKKDWGVSVEKRRIYNESYDYCYDGDKCINSKDHEYYFDGQFFYKPKGQL